MGYSAQRGENGPNTTPVVETTSMCRTQFHSVQYKLRFSHKFVNGQSSILLLTFSLNLFIPFFSDYRSETIYCWMFTAKGKGSMHFAFGISELNLTVSQFSTPHTGDRVKDPAQLNSLPPLKGSYN